LEPGLLMKKILLILAVIAVLVLLAAGEHIVGDPLVRSVTDFLREYRDALGPFAPLVFMALQTLQVLIAPIPGQLTGIVGGALFGAFWGTVYSIIGLTTGSFLAIWLTRLFGRRLVERFVKPDDLAKFDHLAEKSGLAVFFLIFLLPALPDDAVCFIAGLTRLPITALVLMSFLGRLPGLLFLSLAGENIDSYWWLIIVAVVVIAALLIIIRPYIERVFSGRKESRKASDTESQKAEVDSATN
jgi:uncharacterized membrane protein YdjX (TVP38/TMEM64 family)